MRESRREPAPDPGARPERAVLDNDALVALLVTGGSSAEAVRGAIADRTIVIPAQVETEFLRGPGPRAALLREFATSAPVILGTEAPASVVARYVAAGITGGDAAVAAAAYVMGAEVITFDRSFASRLRRLGQPVTNLRHAREP